MEEPRLDKGTLGSDHAEELSSYHRCKESGILMPAHDWALALLYWRVLHLNTTTIHPTERDRDQDKKARSLPEAAQLLQSR